MCSGSARAPWSSSSSAPSPAPTAAWTRYVRAVIGEVGGPHTTLTDENPHTHIISHRHPQVFRRLKGPVSLHDEGETTGQQTPPTLSYFATRRCGVADLFVRPASASDARLLEAEALRALPPAFKVPARELGVVLVLGTINSYT
jgi:hypothetical protein